MILKVVLFTRRCVEEVGCWRRRRDIETLPFGGFDGDVAAGRRGGWEGRFSVESWTVRYTY